MRFGTPRAKRAAVALLVVALVSGAAHWWLNGGKRIFFPRKFAVVAEGFYRAGQIHRRLIEDVLVEHEIGLVVDLARDERGGDPNAVAEREATARLGIPLLELHGLSGSGGGPSEQYVDALAAVLEAREQGANVLVHCAAGSERTGTLVALYRMLFQGWDGPRAYAEYLSFRKRPPDEPKVSRYVSQHYTHVATALAARGLLDAVPELPAGFGPTTIPAVGAGPPD